MRLKVEEARDARVTDFKELANYKMALNTIANQLFAKERLKMKRFYWRHYQIEDMSFLDDIDEEPTFSSANEDEE